MFEYVLPAAVVTPDRKELLPSGSLLNEQVAADVAALGRLQNRIACRLLDYGTVREDLKRFLAIPPYLDIFAARERTAGLVASMEAVQLPLPLLKALDYFRQQDFHTYRHILMVFALSSLLLREKDAYGFDANSLAGPTHDFGKISIPLHILKKPGPLTQQERAVLRNHPMCGYVLLSFYLGDHRHPAAIAARDHHERRNGSGYPRGVCELDEVVEMVAACDIYDALLSPRPYRPLSYDNRTALEELTRMAEAGILGWECVEALVACNRLSRTASGKVLVSRDFRGKPPVGNCYGVVDDEQEDAAASS